MTNKLTNFLLLLLILGMPAWLCAASSTSTSNTPELINEDGCLCKLTGPAYVCPGENFTVKVKVYHEDGSNDLVTVNYPVSISGVAGSTISPNAITQCPDEKDLEVKAGENPAGGELVVKVGKCSHKIKVLTNIVGQWTPVRDPSPNLPAPNPTITPFDTPWVTVAPTFWTVGYTYRTVGETTSTFAVVRADTEWKPSATGTACGQTATITYTENFQYSAGGDFSLTLSIGNIVSVNIPLGGISWSWETSITLTDTIGGEPNTRWRAYAVYPTVHSVMVGRTETEASNLGVGTVPFTKDLGTAVVAGKDWYKEAACCN